MASESPTPPGPPRYILVSQSILSDSVATDSSHRALSHPIIQYVYADDPPTAALPRFPGEQVLVIDNSSTSDPTLVPSSSLSPDLIVTGVKISAAPGTTLMDADVPLGNNNMYVIETMRVKDEGLMHESLGDSAAPHGTLSRFQQRNDALQQVLDNPSAQTYTSPGMMVSSPLSPT